MPSNPECSAFVEQNELNRSVGQLRGFISNQIQKRKADIFSRSGQAPNKGIMYIVFCMTPYILIHTMDFIQLSSISMSYWTL